MGASGSRSADEAPFELPQQEVVSLGARGAPFVGAPGRGSAGVVPPVAHHETIEQVRNPLVWDKASFKVVRSSSSKHLWNFTAEFTSEVPCSLSVHFHCREQVGSHLLEYLPADGHAPPSRTMSFQAGRHAASLEGDSAIDLRRHPLEVFWKFRAKQSDVVPMVLSLVGGRVQSVVHIGLDTPRDGAAKLKCTLLRQKVFVGGREYTLQDVYGLAELGKEDDHDESAVGQPCVICLTEPRNTAVLPCRHMCVCEDCARHLQVGAATHCPICRGDIRGVQVFDVKKR
mmetsp:Transcript_70520/g.216037  ORF Transcript_70520/g.216037 Transcript_70520/m.216037 type:complete len:286 (-) Transcript_70520:74-931(-)